jgi:hypothetical protein
LLTDDRIQPVHAHESESKEKDVSQQEKDILTKKAEDFIKDVEEEDSFGDDLPAFIRRKIKNS